MKTIVIDNVEYELVPLEDTFNNWRLPTIEELITLVDYKKCKPASAVTDTQSRWYWSSTPHAAFADYAWKVYFGDGSVDFDPKDFNFSVRCVRDGEDGLEWSTTSKVSMTWNKAVEYTNTYIGPVVYKENS